MNKKGDLRLTIGLIAAVSLIMTFFAAVSDWGNTITGIFGSVFILAFVFWKFTR